MCSNDPGKVRTASDSKRLLCGFFAKNRVKHFEFSGGTVQILSKKQVCAHLLFVIMGTAMKSTAAVS